MKKTIVFDLGGVLIDWNPRYLYSKIFTDPEEMEFFLRAVCSMDWNVQMDGVKLFQECIEELIPQHPEYESQIRAYFDRWPEMVIGEISGTVAILQELKEAGYPLAGLSNWSAETFPIMEDRFQFLDWFDPLVVSGLVGHIKPNPEIYKILLDELDLKAEDCIFIDDNKDNILTAEKLGFVGLLFSSPENLRKELRDLKII